MLKILRKKIEKWMLNKSADELSKEVFKLLKMFFGDKKETELVREFENKMIKTGKIAPRHSESLKGIVKLEKELSSGKMDPKEFDKIKRDATELIQSLVEYAQRADLVSAEKGTMQIIFENGRKAELVLLGDKNFVIETGRIRKIENSKITESNKADLEKAIQDNQGKLSTSVSNEVFEILRKELGKFDISFKNIIN